MKNEIEVTIWLTLNSSPIEHTECIAYQKESFYCVYHPDSERVYKYPIANIWRICEKYPNGLRRGANE